MQMMAPCYDCFKHSQSNLVCSSCLRKCHAQHRVGNETPVYGICSCGAHNLCTDSDISVMKLDNSIFSVDTRQERVDRPISNPTKILASRQFAGYDHMHAQRPQILNDRFGMFNSGTRGEADDYDNHVSVNDSVYEKNMLFDARGNDTDYYPATSASAPASNEEKIRDNIGQEIYTRLSLSEPDPRMEVKMTDSHGRYQINPDTNPEYFWNPRESVYKKCRTSKDDKMDYYDRHEMSQLSRNTNSIDMSSYEHDPIVRSDGEIHSKEKHHYWQNYGNDKAHLYPTGDMPPVITKLAEMETPLVVKPAAIGSPDYYGLDKYADNAYITPNLPNTPNGEYPSSIYMQENFEPTKKIVGNFSDTTNDFSLRLLGSYLRGMQSKKLVVGSYLIALELYALYQASSDNSMDEIRTFLQCGNRDMVLAGAVQANYYVSRLNPMINYNVLICNWKLNRGYVKDVSQLTTVASVNFSNKPEVDKLGMLVSRKCGMDVTKLMPFGAVAGASLTFISGTYFRPTWKTRFREQHTRPHQFFSPLTTQVNMMYLAESSQYYSDDHRFQLAELQYEDTNLRMGVLLPRSQTDVSYLSWEHLVPYIRSLRVATVNILKIPKFTQTSRFRVDEILKPMGLKHIFERESNFPNIVDEKYKSVEYVDKMIHQATIVVDEKGKETIGDTMIDAAKACASCSTNKINFVADHPFMYYIRHVPMNLLLFVGHFR